MVRDELANVTRAVYAGIHSVQASDPQILGRIRRLITTESLGVESNYFANKVCADLGCGSAVPGTSNLLDLGAKRVHAMDVNDSFVGPASRILSGEAGFENRWQLDIGNICKLPYKNAFFDFVLCQGVIHSVDDDRSALSEVYRVLKPGGMANIMVLGKGGLMTRIVMEAMREEYRENESFRALIDAGMTPDCIQEQLNWLIAQMDDDGSVSHQRSVTLLDCLRDLLDQDFILTLRDRMQTPKYKMYAFEEMADMLRNVGFSSWRRIARKPTFRNVRKIVAPLYHQYDHPLAKLMYGEGALIIIALK